MRLRRFLQVTVAAVALVSPLGALAASVTTDPVTQPAPALTMVMLIVLMIALTGVGMYGIRNRSGGALAGVALVAGLGLLAGLGYAGVMGIVIENGDCNHRSVHVYTVEDATLTSHCPNPIRIEAIDCNVAPTDLACIAGPVCAVDQILQNGDYCFLPLCV
jgi:hypothetical protein